MSDAVSEEWSSISLLSQSLSLSIGPQDQTDPLGIDIWVPDSPYFRIPESIYLPDISISREPSYESIFLV